MLETPVQRAQSATLLTLVISCACALAFIPPFWATTTNSVLLTIIAGLGFLVSMVLHFVFVGITADRMGRSPARWVTLAILLPLLASIIGLILIGWKNDENDKSAQHANGQ
jgi:hypothetical protein